MLRNNLNYPYPVLRGMPIDFKNSLLETEIKIDIDDANKNYIIQAKINTNNSFINNCLDEKKCVKGVFIKCKELWFSRFYEINKDEDISIKALDLYGKVEILPCIIVKEKIYNFYSEDFVDEFHGIDINVNVGEIIGIGEEVSFEAIPKSDIFKKASSIFEFAKSDKKNIDYDINFDKIVVHIPKKTLEKYQKLNPERIISRRSILNSIIVNPILLSVLYEMQDDLESYQNKKWFKTIMNIIQEKKKENKIEGFIQDEIENPLLVLQGLTVGLIDNALKDFIKITESDGE